MDFSCLDCFEVGKGPFGIFGPLGARNRLSDSYIIVLRSAQVLADSAVEICFDFFISKFGTLHNMTTDMPSSVNRWSTPNKEDRRSGSVSPPAIEKPKTITDDKVLS